MASEEVVMIGRLLAWLFDDGTPWPHFPNSNGNPPPPITADDGTPWPPPK